MGMDRAAVAGELVKMARDLTALGGKFVDVRALPDGIQRALQTLRYGRRNIEVVPTRTFSVATAFEGNRAVSVTVDIWSGRTSDWQTGSWGGSNPFEDRPIDRPGNIQVPNDSVVIAGETGGRGNFLRVYVRPEDLDMIMPEGKDENIVISDDEKKALGIVGGIKGGYRAEEFRRSRLGEYGPDNPLIKSLASKGLVKVSRTGIQITTLGRNYR
jgi:hypothetical protein